VRVMSADIDKIC